DNIIPIPGTRTVKHLEELAEGTRRNLTQEELALIDTTLPIGWAHGNRYSISQSKAVEQYC
ncbi:MAG: aldo/keto reductase, partial [Betaproteobacteria bacterium]|nr:aldo/keto reductase [Betaproteobacteria bacterium]